MQRSGEPPWWSFRRRRVRVVVLLAGIILPQLLLYFPSLTGRKILLPLDILALPGIYLPRDVAGRVRVENDVLSDMVYQFEPYRRFAAAEVRAGRMPLWDQYNYCGAPFLANNQSAVLSPYRVLDYVFPSPVTLAWTQLVQAIVAGVGAYLFFRRALRVGFAAAVIGAWCYPLTGALVFWTGYTIGAVITFLPWAMLFADATVRRPLGAGAIGLAIATAAALVAGHSATAAHVLIAAGLFGLFRALHWAYRRRSVRWIFGPALSLALAFALGILLAAPQILPTLQYLGSSYRMTSRMGGQDPTIVMGVRTFGQALLPYAYGTDETTSWRFFKGNIPESAAGAYAGLLLPLALAPLAFAQRRRRASAVFFLLLAFFAALSILGMPVLSEPFGHFPLNALRNNRFVFVSGFALLTLAVLGMDVVRRKRMSRLILLSGALLFIAGAWCLWRAIVPFAALREVLDEANRHLAAGEKLPRPFDSPERLRLGFAGTYAAGFFFAVLGMILVLKLRFSRTAAVRLLWIAGSLAMLELLITAWGRAPQRDPALYYPPLRFAQVLHDMPPGRTVAWYCLPSNLNMMLGLRDVRGYDAVDPQRLIELLNLHRAPDVGKRLVYAQVQFYPPKWPSQIMNMLDVRYVVGRYRPPSYLTPFYDDGEYWVAENSAALGRAFVPAEARVVEDSAERLRLVGEPKFNPREVAYVESASVALPPPPYSGSARIGSEVPTHVVLAAEMQSPGLLVMTDSWDPAWRATVNGDSIPVLRVNHALRGLILPAGRSNIELRYQPMSFSWGLRLAGASLVILAVYGVFIVRRSRVEAR